MNEQAQRLGDNLMGRLSSPRTLPSFTSRKKSNRVVPIFITSQNTASVPSAASSSVTSVNGREIQKQTLPQRHREVLVHECGYWYDKSCPACLEESYPLDNYLELPGVDNPSPLGVLEAKLPRELIDMIINRCDILSLTRLRYVNRRGRQLVSEHPKYNAIVQYVPRIIRYMLDRGLESGRVCGNISLGAMYSLATDKHCFQCDSFSIYIDLVERKRICAECVDYDQRCCCSDFQNTWNGVTIQDLESHYGKFKGHQGEQPKARIIKDKRLLDYYTEKFVGKVPNITYNKQEHRKITLLAQDRHPEVMGFVSEDHPPYVREYFTELMEKHCSPWDKVVDAYKRYLFYTKRNLCNTQVQQNSERKREELIVRVPWLDPNTYDIYWE